MSDFVLNLVRRAAGLPVDTSARPPFQPAFAPDLPPIRWQAAAQRPVEVLVPPQTPLPGLAPPAAEPLQEPRQSPATASPAGGRDVMIQPQPAPPPAPQKGDDQAPPVHRQQASPSVQPMPDATPVQTAAPTMRPTPNIAPSPSVPPSTQIPAKMALDEPPAIRPPTEPPVSRPPRPARAQLLSQPPQARTPALPQATPRQPVTSTTVDMSRPGGGSPAAVEGMVAQPIAVEPGTPLRVGQIAARELEMPLARVLPAPVLPLLHEIAPPTPRQAAAVDTAPVVQVHIGTVEVRASRPVPPAPPRPRPRPQGFEDYARLRGLEGE